MSWRRRTLAFVIGFACVVSGVSMTPGGAVGAEAPRDAGAERFVQVQGQRVVSILSDRSQNPSERWRSLRAALLEITDAPRIARFVLGKYARTITLAQMQRFEPLFRDYADAVYRDRLQDFQGDTFAVTGSVVRKPGDVIVAATISGGNAPPGQVHWRVLASGATWKVVDLEFSGVWLSITQQQDFVSTIDNHGGDIDALITRLEQLTRAPRAPAGRP